MNLTTEPHHSKGLKLFRQKRNHLQDLHQEEIPRTRLSNHKSQKRNQRLKKKRKRPLGKKPLEETKLQLSHRNRDKVSKSWW